MMKMFKMVKASFHTLEDLCQPHGLYKASTGPDYNKVWIRDSVYMALPYLKLSCGTYEKTVHRLLDLFLELEDVKITHHTKVRPQVWFEYIHAAYSVDDVKEIPDHEWGHAQHDAIGAFLWMVGAGVKHGRKVLRNADDVRILQKLVDYLVCVEYWADPDNGMWEEYKELHASSVGACLSGLMSVSRIVKVPSEALYKGIKTMSALGTRESESKEIDLAQLSLIYPYDVLPKSVAEQVVNLVEQKLKRKRGVARYFGDSYYSTLEEEHGRGRARSFYAGSEAEWTFGIPWLALCHMHLGNTRKARAYIQLTESLMTAPGVLPELYYAGTSRPNPNTPLGWSSAMYLLAVDAYTSNMYLDSSTEVRGIL